DDGRGRAARVEARALIPGGGEPVGREGGREASADHKPEIATRGYRDQSRLSRARQVLHHRQRIDGAAGERATEPRTQLVDGCGLGDRAPVLRLEPVGRDLRRADEQIARHRGATARLAPDIRLHLDVLRLPPKLPWRGLPRTLGGAGARVLYEIAPA